VRVKVKEWLHRRGWLASPSLSFKGVPFGPDKRDLAGEVMRSIYGNHNPDTCEVCMSACQVGDRGPWCDGCPCWGKD
jgi:hypothetical protein